MRIMQFKTKNYSYYRHETGTADTYLFTKTDNETLIYFVNCIVG